MQTRWRQFRTTPESLCNGTCAHAFVRTCFARLKLSLHEFQELRKYTLYCDKRTDFPFYFRGKYLTVLPRPFLMYTSGHSSCCPWEFVWVATFDTNTYCIGHSVVEGRGREKFMHVHTYTCVRHYYLLSVFKIIKRNMKQHPPLSSSTLPTLASKRKKKC